MASYDPTIHAGDLISRISIQNQGPLDDHGQPNPEWQLEFDRVPAFIEQLGGSKKLGGDRSWNSAVGMTQLIPQETHRVTIRYIAGLDATRRVLFEGKVLEVLTVSDYQSRHIWMTLSCMEKVGVTA